MPRNFLRQKRLVIPTQGDIREISRDGTIRIVEREWVPEHPIALEFNGLAYAVMMGSPSDLEDFARGFALTEGLARSVKDIDQISVAQVELGWIVRTNISGLKVENLIERVRTRAAESSCGLCGIENLQALSKPLPPVVPHAALDPAMIFRAMKALRDHQPLSKATGAAHVAAFASIEGVILWAREDVGRHNAMDKLIGAMAAVGADAANGLFISSARCSYEIVEKSVRAGATRLATISLPTSMAVTRATAAGLSIYCLARNDSILQIA